MDRIEEREKILRMLPGNENKKIIFRYSEFFTEFDTLREMAALRGVNLGFEEYARDFPMERMDEIGEPNGDGGWETEPILIGEDGKGRVFCTDYFEDVAFSRHGLCSKIVAEKGVDWNIMSSAVGERMGEGDMFENVDTDFGNVDSRVFVKEENGLYSLTDDKGGKFNRKFSDRADVGRLLTDYHESVKMARRAAREALGEALRKMDVKGWEKIPGIAAVYTGKTVSEAMGEFEVKEMKLRDYLSVMAREMVLCKNPLGTREKMDKFLERRLPELGIGKESRHSLYEELDFPGREHIGFFCSEFDFSTDGNSNEIEEETGICVPSTSPITAERREFHNASVEKDPYGEWLVAEDGLLWTSDYLDEDEVNAVVLKDDGGENKVYAVIPKEDFNVPEVMQDVMVARVLSTVNTDNLKTAGDRENEAEASIDAWALKKISGVRAMSAKDAVKYTISYPCMKYDYKTKKFDIMWTDPVSMGERRLRFDTNRLKAAVAEAKKCFTTVDDRRKCHVFFGYGLVKKLEREQKRKMGHQR